MQKMVEWAIRHPTVVNLMMIGILAVSLFAMDQLPKETFPETALDEIRVDVEYRGAGPKEVETGVLIKIEEAVTSIVGIHKISSEAKENVATVRLELQRGSDTRRILRDVKDAIGRISTFPDNVKTPVIYKPINRESVMEFALSGNATRTQLQTLADDIKDQLLRLSLVKQVNLSGTKKREIAIEINEESLRRYQLKVADVTQALKAANFDMSGGKIRMPGEDIRVRIYGKKYLAKDIEQLIIRNLPGGNAIRIRDIARAKESFEDDPKELLYKGKPAILLSIVSTREENVLKIAAQVKSYHAQLKKKLPPGIRMEVFEDTTISLKSRIQLLLTNGGQGLFLVLFVLAFFMNVRLAFWVAAGLFLSILGSFISALTVGLSINMLSLFGLILVIGILVDDAIVVAENVYVHLERGKSPVQAAIDGTMEVLPAVLTAVTTTCLTFMPLFFMGGFIGKFIYMIPAMVIAALLWSLFESFFILPPHLAHSLKPRNSVEYTQNRVRKWTEGLFEILRVKIYANMLKRTLHYRWATLAFAVGTFILSIGLLGGGWVKFVFFPKIEGDRIVVRFAMPPGTPASETRKIASLAKAKLLQIGKHIEKREKQTILLSTMTRIGSQTGGTHQTGEEVGEVLVKMIKGEKRKITSFEVVKMWRKALGKPRGVLTIQYDQVGVGPLGRALEFQLGSKDPHQLRRASEFLKKRLARFQGVYNPDDDLNRGKRELRLRRTPLAVSLGISLRSIANQVRYRLYGQDVMQLQRGRDDVRVTVRYPIERMKQLTQLKNIWIVDKQGKRLPLSQLVTWTVTRELKVIRRLHRQRTALVFAQLDESRGNRQDILTGLLERDIPELKKLFPSVQMKQSGQGEEQGKVIGGMKVMFPLAMFAIFFVLSILFPSYGKSLIIMLMIPFGLVGAVVGHWIMGIPLTILSFFGIVGVAGVVVNDAIVLMDAIERHAQQETSIVQAVWLAGQSRLRAILSTTLTTAAGLLPLLLERSMQAQFLIPMALSLAAGVVFASFLTLFLVPSLYLIRLDLKSCMHWLKTGTWLELSRMHHKDTQAHEEPASTSSQELCTQ